MREKNYLYRAMDSSTRFIYATNDDNDDKFILDETNKSHRFGRKQFGDIN